VRCRLCGSIRLISVLDLGAMPLCESFLAAGELDSPEPTYPLHLRLCEDCLLLQIPNVIAPDQTCTEYADFSSQSDSLVQHAKSFVDQAAERLQLGDHSFVVEVASNDGYLLQHAVAMGIPCVGIEPSMNVVAAALGRGVPTVAGFLNEQLAATVRAEHGPADLVVANNVYAHVPDLLGFTRSLRGLLAEDGWLSIEVHHALNLVDLGEFDSIYHENFQNYTVLSATRALATADLRVVDVEIIPSHGGSIRIWARRDGAAGPPSRRLADVLRMEQAAGLHHVSGYWHLRNRTEAVRHALLRFLLDCHVEGKRVVGYGAPREGNILLNYCGIRSDLLEYTVDRNPHKQGRFTPGTRIPIYEPAQIARDRPDVVLALPWRLKSEVTKELTCIAEWGGQLVFPLPTLHTAFPSKLQGTR
jgi:SAM-dependent methyltransferase